ncbi:hypothetical protein MKK68_24555 [Methylobacterium sp. E-016]|uniref:hypothetical protein n=1 Tax=Methylobacterium sp. E-016 TaxID=2836556 RepID=UPI001FBA2E32|nr:hypothetical protein [Methylobacterium sp. E-016]MCJ2078774.1 hypothetical protein [Methylobacterium sp. E-016]
MSRSGTSLDATLGSLQRTAASLAIGSLDDVRAQRWLALRLPAACRPRDRMTLFPSPFGTPLNAYGIEGDDQPDRSCHADHPVYRDALARSEISDRTVVAGYLRGESVVTCAGNSVPPTLQVVTDWLNGLWEEDPRFLDKLPRVTWDQAEVHAERWHQRMLTKRADRVAGNEGTVDRLDVPALPGWLWVHLVTERALDAEGSIMGHCVGRGYDHTTWSDGVRPDDWRADAGIWSLRDPVGRSRVTVEIAHDGIVQAQGPGNDRPEAETVPAFAVLIERFEKVGIEFDVPYWLVREESGATHLRMKEEARADFEARREPVQTVAYGQVMFRPAGGDTFVDLGDVDGLRIDMQPTRRQRYARRGAIANVEAVTTSLEAEIQLTPTDAARFVEAMSRLRDNAAIDAIVGPGRPASQMEEDPPAAPLPRVRSDRDAGLPRYRRHERQQDGRRPR